MGGYFGQAVDSTAPALKKVTGNKIDQQWDQANSWIKGGGKPSGNSDDSLGHAWGQVTGKNAKDNQESQLEGSQAQQAASAQGIMAGMQQNGQDYYSKMNNAYNQAGGYKDTMNSSVNSYLSQAQKLQADMENQAKDSKATYSNSILPRLQGVMEDAQKNAGSAMTLEQAGDPNNAVATATRNMYNTQAQGINRTGLADAGVLQAMGSQATAGQFGAAGGLLTGGQLQGLQGANLGQSGAAMARAQQRANDLRQQGIQAGSDASAAQYDRGQGAKQFYNQAIGNYENGYNSMNDYQDKYRGNIGAQQQNIMGTQLGQANANLGIDTGLAGLQYGIQTQDANRQLTGIDAKYANQQGNLVNSINAGTAANNAGMNAAGTVVGAVGGGLAGGPAGAAAGSAAGGAMAQSQNQPMQQAPAQANYSNGYNGQGPVTNGTYGYQANNPYASQR